LDQILLKKSEINVEKIMCRMKKVLTILWVVLFVVSLTAVTVSVARHHRSGHHSLWLPPGTPLLASPPWLYIYLTVT